MKIVSWLISILIVTQVLGAESTKTDVFQLQVGKHQTIQLGETLDLDGKVTFGDKSKIEKYHWEEDGKVLLNTSGDEIVYWDSANSENGHTPLSEGTHFLKFVVTGIDGQQFDRTLRIKVEKIIDSPNAIKFDFPVLANENFERYINMKIGDTVALSAMIQRPAQVDFYRWEKDGKVLTNKVGDKILYWDEKNRENDYVPTENGEYFLDFIVTNKNGKEVKKKLLLKVSLSDVNVVIDEHDLDFDLNSNFIVKREQRSEANYRLSRGHYIEVNVGDIIPLSGIVKSSKKHLVDFYRWELGGKIISNQQNDKILYWDEENRENDYLAKASGKEFLKFIVTDINGNETSKTLLLKISNVDGSDDHGNDMSSASIIALNTLINAKHETQNDHDFFKFVIDKKQYVRVVLTQRGPRPVQIFSEDGTNVEVGYLSIPASGGMVRIYQTIFESGIYYVDVHKKLGDYTLEIKVEDIEKDKVGDSKDTATEIQVGTETVGYLNNKSDIDYFYIIAPKTGELTVKNIADKSYFIKVDDTLISKSFNVEKGKKYYFSLTYNQSRGSAYLTQLKYNLSLSLK